MRTITVFLMVLVLVGCAGLNLKQEGARTAIEAATLEYIDGNAARANRVYEITDGLIESTEDKDAMPVKEALRLIESKARERIEWDQLNETEAIVVDRLIDAARAEIEHQIEQGAVDQSTRVAVVTVLQWVRNIAQISGGGDGNQLQAMGSYAALGPRRKDYS